MVAIDEPDPVRGENERAPGVVEFGSEQLAARMGIEIIEYTPDRVVGQIPVSGNRQPYGLLHGGANAVLAETVASYAAGLHAGPERIAVGLELSCTHHRAATEGIVTGVATPLHRGGSTASYEIVLSDEQDNRTCTARLTCVLRDKPPRS